MKHITLFSLLIIFSFSSLGQYPHYDLFVNDFAAKVYNSRGQTIQDMYNIDEIKTLLYFKGAITMGSGKFPSSSIGQSTREMDSEIAIPASFGGKIYLDLNDLLGHTQEGQEGWVTFWIDFETNIPVVPDVFNPPVGIGMQFSELNYDYDDPIRKGSVSLVDIVSPIEHIKLINFSGVDPDNPTGVETELELPITPQGFSVSIFNTTINLAKGEINIQYIKQLIEDSFIQLGDFNFSGGGNNKEFANTLINNLIAFEWYGDYDLKYNLGVFRDFSNYDDPDYSQINCLGLKKFGKKTDGVHINRFDTYIDPNLPNHTRFYLTMKTDAFQSKDYVIKAKNITDGWDVRSVEDDGTLAGTKYPIYGIATNYNVQTEWGIKPDPGAPETASIDFVLYRRYGHPPINVDIKLDTISVTLSSVDNIAPIISGHNINTSGSNPIEIIFSELMNIASIDNSITITGDQHNIIEYTTNYDYNTNKCSIIIVTNLIPNENISCSISTFAKDNQGNNMQNPYNLNYQLDPLPLVQIVNPQNGAIWRQNNSYLVQWSRTATAPDALDVKLLKGGAVLSTLASAVTGNEYLFNIQNSYTTGVDYQFVIVNTDGSITDTTTFFSILEPVYGHDLELKNVQIDEEWVQPGDDVEFSFFVKNPGQHTESNYSIICEISDQLGNILETKSIPGVSIPPSPNDVIPIFEDDLNTSTSLEDGFYQLKIEINFSDDVANANNIAIRNIYIGSENPYRTYRFINEGTIYYKNSYQSLSGTNYKLKLEVHDYNTARVRIKRNDDGFEEVRYISLNHLEFFDAFQLLIVYDGYFSSTEAVFLHGYPTTEVNFYPEFSEIEAGKTETINVESNEEDPTPSINIYNDLSDDYNVVSQWSYDAYVLGNPYSSVYWDITVSSNTSRQEYTFWAKMTADGQFLQKMKIEIIDPIPDITYTIDKDNLNIAPNITDNINVTISPIDGFSEYITAYVSGLPDSVNVSISNYYFQPPENIQVSFSVTDGVNTFGYYPIVLNLVSATRHKAINLGLNIIDNSENFISIDSVKYIDDDFQLDSLEIFYTSQFTGPQTGVTSDWEYTMDGINWISIPETQILNNTQHPPGSYSIIWDIPSNIVLQSNTAHFKMKAKNGYDYLQQLDYVEYDDAELNAVNCYNGIIYVYDEDVKKVHKYTYDEQNGFTYLGNFNIYNPYTNHGTEFVRCNNKIYLFDSSPEYVTVYNYNWQYITSYSISEEWYTMFARNDSIFFQYQDEDVFVHTDQYLNPTGYLLNDPFGQWCDFSFNDGKNVWTGKGDDLYKISLNFNSYIHYIIEHSLEGADDQENYLFGADDDERLYAYNLRDPYSFPSQSSTFLLNNTWPPSITTLPILLTNEDTDLIDVVILNNYLSDNDTPIPDLNVSVVNQYGINLNIDTTNQNTITVIPNTDFNGPAYAILLVSDNYNIRKDTLFVNITSVNDPPVLSFMDTPIPMIEDISVYFTLSEYVNDVDHTFSNLLWSAWEINSNLLNPTTFYTDSMKVAGKPNTYGMSAQLVVQVNDGINMCYDTLLFNIFSEDDAPTNFSRGYPPDLSGQNPSSTYFNWTSSTDIEDSTLLYLVTIESSVGDTGYVTADTSMIIDLFTFYDTISECDTVFWNVYAFDGDKAHLASLNNGQFFTYLNQQIDLNSGWNLASFYVQPKYFQLDSILKPLMNSNTLVKVINESGGFIQYIPGIGWMNTIGSMASTEGYYVKVNADDTLYVSGVKVPLPIDIPLQTGWNIMGYPIQTSQNAVSALQPLIDSLSLIKVINESGGFIQYIPGIGWMNTIGNFEAGEGYYIKLNANDTLMLNEVVTSAPLQQSFIYEGEYYRRSNSGNPYLPMHIVANFDNIPIAEGDELGVFIDDDCIGSSYISDINSPVVAFLTTDDPTTNNIDGGVEGKKMTFKLLHKGREYILECQNLEPEEILFVPLETKFLTFSITGLGTPENGANMFSVSEVIPNPFSTKARIHINIPAAGKLQVDMVDLRGVEVRQLFTGDVDAQKLEIQINGDNLVSGMYFVIVTYESDGKLERVLRKVVVN